LDEVAVPSVDPAVLAVAASPRGQAPRTSSSATPDAVDDKPGWRQITFISWQSRAFDRRCGRTVRARTTV